jgi:DNA-binding NarL/FixJ family response regulator
MQIGVEHSTAVDNKRIFIVHRDEIIRAALQFMLHDENEAHEIPGLEQAFERAALTRVDAVLVELELVRERGVQLIGEFASHLPGAKILVVADRAIDPFIDQCVRAGAFGAISKPLRVEAVRGRVDAVLGRVRNARQ